MGVPSKASTFSTFDEVRQGIKDYANWPTIPQLWVKGRFVGGSDIMMEMFQSGELKQLLTERQLPGWLSPLRPGGLARFPSIHWIKPGSRVRRKKNAQLFAAGDQKNKPLVPSHQQSQGRVPPRDRSGNSHGNSGDLVYIAQMFRAISAQRTLPLAPDSAFNSYLCSTVHVAHAHRMRGNRWTDDRRRETMKKGPQT
jgi:hypothetical protein